MFASNAKKAAAALVLGVSAFVSTTAFAGDVNGAGCLREQVLANRTDVFRMTFEGGASAFINLNGDSDTRLVLDIRDENGNQIHRSAPSRGYISHSWTPRWTGEYQIRVQNLGGVYNEYRLCTN